MKLRNFNIEFKRLQGDKQKSSKEYGDIIIIEIGMEVN